jgi:hypothetical protein
MKNLTQVLKQAGKPTKLFKSTDGSRVLVLPYGGRVLGLFAPGSDQNFYWTHDALASVESARAFYAGDQWHNSGGDRTWLAPEADLFFPNFPKLDKYFQQRSLDPGKYRVVDGKNTFSLVNQLKVNFARLKKEVPLKITKSFGPALNPLRREKGLDLEGIEYAGYTQYTSLAITGSNAPGKTQVGLWNLVQMPHAGDLLIPTFNRSEPRHIFSTIDTIPAADLITSDHLIRYRMRQKGEHKISVRAVSVCGRVGYLHPTEDDWALIVRNFVVNPSGEYVDVPWTETDYFGFAVQACNVNSGLGQFSELEYHIPAVGHGTGRLSCDDEAQVWAFRGPREKIDQISQILLGARSL